MRRFFRLFCQLTHFFGDHREAPSLFSGPGRFDRRVERQQVGLSGNAGNRIDDLADFLGPFAQLGNDSRRGVHGLLDPRHLLNRLFDSRPAILRLFPRLFRLSGDQAGIGGDLFDPGRHFLDDGGSIRSGHQLGIGAGGHLGHGHRHLVGGLRGLLGARRQFFAGGGQLFGI